MKKFLLKTLIAVTLFSFTGVGGSQYKTIIVQAQQSVVDALGNPTVYYTSGGKSFHLSRNCSTLSKSKNVHSGQLKDVISSKSDPCNVCVRYTSSTTSSNSNKNTSNSNTSTQKNNVIQLNVNKEELKKYLENAYKKAFGRDIDVEGLNYWMNQLSQGKVTIKDFILNLIGSDEFNNLNLDVKEKIGRAYGIMFGRNADDEGLNYWMNQYNKNLKNNNSKNAIVLTVKEMMKSDELKQIAQKIGILY